MKTLNESTIIVCSIVRDAEQGLRANIPVVRKLCGLCKDYRIVVFENDSKDATKELLELWSAEDRQRIHAMCSNTDGARTIPLQRDVIVNRFFCRQRIEKMARLRNQYLEYVERQGWLADYLIVVDLDVAQLYLKGILNSFTADRDWDAVTAFGYSTSPRLKRRYHDTYALTKWGEQDIPQTEAMITRYADELGGMQPSDGWLRVYSAFGGLAIYRFEAIRGLRYDVLENDDPRVEVRSEHVGLYKQMMLCGHDRVYVNPAMTVWYQRVNLKVLLAFVKRMVHL